MTTFTPSRYQQAIFDFVAEQLRLRAAAQPFRHLVIDATAGSGKCLGRDVQVLMYSGEQRPAQDIKTGDLLMGPDSKPRLVTSTCSGTGPLFRITPVKGESWVCNDAHILTLVGSNSGRVFDISMADYLIALARPPRKKGGVYIKQDYVRDAKLLRTGVEFEAKTEQPISPYLLGLWIGDGTTNNTGITTGDSEIEETIRAEAKSFGLPVKVFQKRGAKCQTFQMAVPRDAKGYSPREKNPFWSFIRDNCRVQGAKSIPSAYLRASRSSRLELLAGLIDTDGHLGCGYFEITTKLPVLRDQYLFLARSLGFAAYVHRTWNWPFQKEYWRIMISGDVDQVPTRLPRKQAKPRQQIKSVLRTGFSVEALGEGEYFGFTLAGGEGQACDGRFLLGDFTITHNTSTIIETCKRLPPHTRALVVAFNARVADELKTRLPSNATALTLHSLGKRAWGTYLQVHPKTVRDKVWGIIDAEVAAHRMSRYHRFKVAKLVDLARQRGIVPYCGPEGTQTQSSARVATSEYPNKGVGATTPRSAVNGVIPLHGLIADTDAAWLELCHNHDIYGDDKTSMINAARRVLVESIKWGHRGIDFADMLYLPVTAKVSFEPDADVVFVDELQDLDALQRRMVVSMARTGALLVGVGDTRQAVYGFRGADTDSMRKVRQEAKATELPLSICYRCPVSHIELARTVSPQIEARDGADEGVLERYNETGKRACDAPHKHGLDCDCKLTQRSSLYDLTAQRFQPGDLVLCRSKAPLVKAAYWLIRHNVPCSVLGKDIGKVLVAFVDSFRVDNIVDLLSRVNRTTAVALSRASDDSEDVEDITDRRDVIVAVADACETNDVAELKDRLQKLFSDSTDRADVVTLSTIHRAKGAEADRVWWIDRQRLSLDKNFRHEWRREEEKSIIFVGSTRSRRELRFICSEFMR